jgi:hypothetical protein
MGISISAKLLGMAAEIAAGDLAKPTSGEPPSARFSKTIETVCP